MDSQFTEKKKVIPSLQWTKLDWAVPFFKKVGSLGPEKTSGVKLAKEWISGSVTSSAPNLRRKQRALKKKLFEHGSTKTHVTASNICDKGDCHLSSKNQTHAG